MTIRYEKKKWTLLKITWEQKISAPWSQVYFTVATGVWVSKSLYNKKKPRFFIHDHICT